jgi:hypothetical protein
MSNIQEKEWTESVLNSMRGASRVQPNPAILDRIKADLSLAKVQQLSPMKKIILIAAAMAILIININALNILNKNQSNSEDKPELYSYNLITDYKI